MSIKSTGARSKLNQYSLNLFAGVLGWYLVLRGSIVTLARRLGSLLLAFLLALNALLSIGDRLIGHEALACLGFTA